MRIVVFATYYHPFVGGYVRNVETLFGRLVVEKGYKVTVVTCNTEGVSELEDNGYLRVIRLPCWHLFGGTYPVPKPCLRTAWWLRQLFRESVDVVSTQARIFPLSVIGAVYARVRRIPLVHTERGAYHSVVQNKVVLLLARLFDHTVGSMIVRMAARRIGVSWATCRFMEHVGGDGWDCIPNGVEKGWLLRPHSPEGMTVVFVGRLIHAKGVQDLIAAMRRVREELPDAELVVVGDGRYRATLEAMDGDTRFLGQLESGEVAEVLSRSTVFVNPSYSEGLPTGVMEAAALAVPVVATTAGGTSEIIRHGETGFLIEPGDIGAMARWITYLMVSPEKAGRMGRAARETIRESFGWDTIVERYHEVFTDILER